MGLAWAPATGAKQAETTRAAHAETTRAAPAAATSVAARLPSPEWKFQAMVGLLGTQRPQQDASPSSLALTTPPGRYSPGVPLAGRAQMVSPAGAGGKRTVVSPQLGQIWPAMFSTPPRMTARLRSNSPSIRGRDKGFAAHVPTLPAHARAGWVSPSGPRVRQL